MPNLIGLTRSQAEAAVLAILNPNGIEYGQRDGTVGCGGNGAINSQDPPSGAAMSVVDNRFVYTIGWAAVCVEAPSVVGMTVAEAGAILSGLLDYNSGQSFSWLSPCPNYTKPEANDVVVTSQDPGPGTVTWYVRIGCS